MKTNLLNINLSYMLLKNSVEIFGIEVKFYGIIISCAMLIAIFMARRLATKRNINPDEIYVLALFIIPLSILGARIYYCIFSENSYNFTEFFNIRQGGLAIYGGVIGGIVGIILYCLVKKNIKLLPVLFDICVPVLIIAQGIGRWGNFFNQEAYGSLITNENFQWFPFGVYIEDLGEWHLATFFYESIWDLIGGIILMFVFYKSKFTLTTTASYLIYYGTGRFLIEGLRTDSLYLLNTSIRVSQALSLVMIVIGIAILGYNYFKHKKGKDVTTVNNVKKD